MTDDQSSPTADDIAREQLQQVRDAAQKLADTVRQALEMRMGALGGPPIPVLPSLLSPAPAETDPRLSRVVVSLTPMGVSPHRGQHTYVDEGGLSWVTYGKEHDYSEDMALDITNHDGETIASYPPGTWSSVHYYHYREMDA